MGEGEGSRAEAEENDLSGGPQENCRGAAGTVGEVEGNHLGGRTKADRDGAEGKVSEARLRHTGFALLTDSAGPTTLGNININARAVMV